MKYFYSGTLADEALYYSTIYPNSRDLGTARACKLGLWPTPHVGWGSAKPNPTVCCIACRWRLRSALRADQESFSIESSRLLDSKALCRQLRVVLQTQCC